MIIDVHSHSILKSWVSAARAASSAGVATIHGIDAPEWTPELAIDAMDATGISAMILSNPTGAVAAGPEGEAALARSMNEEMAVIRDAHPSRFGIFAVIPLFHIDQAIAEALYALDELHCEGVCLQTNFAGDYLGDERFAPLFAELDKRRAVAFIHPTTPTFFNAISLPFNESLFEFMFETTRAVASLIYSGMRERYPNFAIIATHGGGTVPFLAHRMSIAPSIIPTGYGKSFSPSDVQEALSTFHFDLTASNTPAMVAGLLAMTTPGRLLAGFDFPYMPASTMRPARDALETSKLLSGDDLTSIKSGNASQLFARLRKRIEEASSNKQLVT